MKGILKLTAFFLILTTLTSCSPVIRLMIGLHDPVVETPESIARFIEKSGYRYSHNYMLQSKSDSASIFQNLFLSGAGRIMLFDNKGTRYCYADTDTMSCPGNLYEMAFASLDSNFVPCANDSMLLSGYMENFRPMGGTGELTFADSSYYIIYYWAKFLGGKRKYKDDLQWLAGLKASSPYNITILAVNTDLQESWGLIPGRKLRMKLKVSRKGGSAEFGPIPFSSPPSAISNQQSALSTQ